MNRSGDNRSDAPPVRQAVIIAGGRGTRLGALTDKTPKPLLDVGGRPFIEHLLFELDRSGIEEAVLLVGPFGDVFRRALRPERPRQPRLVLVSEPEPAGTAGALWHARESLADRFYVLNGDSILDGNLLRLDAASRAEPLAGAMAVLAVPDTARYGRVELAGDRVSVFREKGEAGPGLVNAGVYLFHRDRVLARIATPPSSLEQEILPALAAERSLRAVMYQGRFVDIGIPASLAAARGLFPAWHRRPAALIALDALLGLERGGNLPVTDLRWRRGAEAALRRLNDAGCYAIVLAAPSAAPGLRRRMNTALMPAAAHIDGLFAPRFLGTDATLLRAVEAEWPIEREGSFLIMSGSWETEKESAPLLPVFRAAGDSDLDDLVSAALGDRG